MNDLTDTSQPEGKIRVKRGMGERPRPGAEEIRLRVGHELGESDVAGPVGPPC